MRSPRSALIGLIGVLALSACGTAATIPPPVPASSASRDVQVSAIFSTSGGTAITYDPTLVNEGARGAVSSESGGGNTTVKLAVRGLLPNRSYGAHAHQQPCGATGDAAGPHFQKVVDPVQPSVDPEYANPQNEIWLDLTTDPTGAGSTQSTVPWEFSLQRRARSVIIHAMPTATAPGEAGVAGGRAACIDVDF